MSTICTLYICNISHTFLLLTIVFTRQWLMCIPVQLLRSVWPHKVNRSLIQTYTRTQPSHTQNNNKKLCKLIKALHVSCVSHIYIYIYIPNHIQHIWVSSVLFSSLFVVQFFGTHFYAFNTIKRRWPNGSADGPIWQWICSELFPASWVRLGD